ncbi:neurite extension and migration factor-like isoform X1 [Chiloscyllium plagiosum]|uniref:neurite extension and migration factor-like isoform X1 n=1 Tax=Chiloscyllium plagiosum TaxID=36176 RepID=UPI001CB7DF5A|nr:neurite extension and migration factor-like isoform X1 [Chiloscyllium plagiosum]XP_043547041.1 neurite extension and migration factor-like isoform X1 [Chiloscyllium plagiosum]XP_043547042.1 neurite extension and migration factor-like isoform X1 [Chiloscyllium plagiosum]
MSLHVAKYFGEITMEAKDYSWIQEKYCESPLTAEGISETNEIDCCELGAKWRLCKNKLSKENTMSSETHFSVFQTEDTISDQMLNFSLNGITCENKFGDAQVVESDTTANAHESLFMEKYNGDDALLPIPSQSWSYFESFINENKDEFLDLCATSDFSANLISEEDSDSFLFDDESTLSNDVCSLKIKYESFQDNIREKTNAFQDDAQVHVFPNMQCNGTKKDDKSPIKTNSSVQEKQGEHDSLEHCTLYELENNKCVLSGVFMDSWKDRENPVDSVCLSSILNEDRENWELLRKSTKRYSNQTNYTLRAKRQIRYSDDYLYDIDSLETMKSLGKKDHLVDAPQEDDDDWYPQKRKKPGKKEPPVIIKYIIVNRFKGHKNMHVKICRLDCTERQVLLTDEMVKKYKKLSPLKEFWSPIPNNCNVCHNQEKLDKKLKVCSGAGMSYMFFSSKNKKQTLANGMSSIKIGCTLSHQKDNVIETDATNTEVPKKVQKYDKSVYEFTDEIELKRITIRTVSKTNQLRVMHEDSSLEKLQKKHNIPSKKRRANGLVGKNTCDRNSLQIANEKSQVPNVDMPKIPGQLNSASSLLHFNNTSLHSPAFSDKLEAHNGLLSPVLATSFPDYSASNTRLAPEVLGEYFRSLLHGEDSSVNENIQDCSQPPNAKGQNNEGVTENTYFPSLQKQTDEASTGSNYSESNTLYLAEKPNIQEAWDVDTVQNVHPQSVMGKDQISLCTVNSQNERLQFGVENRTIVNSNINQYGLKMSSNQNEINSNFSQKASKEETKQLVPSKDSPCILDISNFTPAKVKQGSFKFSQEYTPKIVSTTEKSDIKSLEQCNQTHLPSKTTSPNLYIYQCQICSELSHTDIHTYYTNSDPTCVSLSQPVQSSIHPQASDNVNSSNYNYSKINKAINSTRKRFTKSNEGFWEKTAVQKKQKCNDEVKTIKIESFEKDSVSPEDYKAILVQGNSSDTLYANQLCQHEKKYKSVKGFTNNDSEVCTELVQKELMNSKTKLAIKEPKLHQKGKYSMASEESYDGVSHNITRESRLLNGGQREFEEPGNILSNIVSGMAAVNQFMMASVEPVMNQMAAVNQPLEVQNHSKWKPKPMHILHIGTKDPKSKPMHISECNANNVGVNSYPVNHTASCYTQQCLSFQYTKS